MFRFTKQAPDVERGPEILNFEDPSWILDHHRHNLIQKISRPEHSFGLLGFFRKKSSAQSDKVDTGHQAPQHKPNQNNSGKNISPPGPNGQSAVQHPNQKQLEKSQQSYRMNFSELQRLYLRQLQHKLVQHVVDLTYNAREPVGWAEDLRKYGECHVRY